MRPTIVGVLALALLISPIGKKQVLASNPDPVQFQWESRDRSLLDAQRTFLSEKGGQVGEVEEKEPDTKNPAAVALLIVAGVAAASALADAIVRAVKDYQHGGLVVDLRGAKVKIVENQSLERGQVFIVKPNGEVVSYTYKSGSSPDLSALIANLLAGAKSP